MDQCTFNKTLLNSIETEIELLLEENYHLKGTYRSPDAYAEIRMKAPRCYEEYFDLIYDIAWTEGTWTADDFTLWMECESGDYHPNDEIGLCLQIRILDKPREAIYYLWEEWKKAIKNKDQKIQTFNSRSMKEIMLDEFKEIHKTCFALRTEPGLSVSIEPGQYLFEYMQVVDRLCFAGSNWKEDDFYFDTERVRTDEGGWEHFAVLNIYIHGKSKADLVQLWMMWEEAM